MNTHRHAVALQRMILEAAHEQALRMDKAFDLARHEKRRRQLASNLLGLAVIWSVIALSVCAIYWPR